jgi:hypothetical protein
MPALHCLLGKPAVLGTLVLLNMPVSFWSRKSWTASECPVPLPVCISRKCQRCGHGAEKGAPVLRDRGNGLELDETNHFLRKSDLS